LPGHVTSPLMRQSWQASKAAQTMKKAEEELETERVTRVLKKVPIYRCMEHRHSYVRKNAVFAVYVIIYREFENLMLDAPELLQTFLVAESDVTCKGNVFVFLAHCAMPKAVEWILSVYEQILTLSYWG
jgi:vesicle coat complex subunit